MRLVWLLLSLCGCVTPARAKARKGRRGLQEFGTRYTADGGDWRFLALFLSPMVDWNGDGDGEKAEEVY